MKLLWNILRISCVRESVKCQRNWSRQACTMSQCRNVSITQMGLRGSRNRRVLTLSLTEPVKRPVSKFHLKLYARLYFF